MNVLTPPGTDFADQNSVTACTSDRQLSRTVALATDGLNIFADCITGRAEHFFGPAPQNYWFAASPKMAVLDFKIEGEPVSVWLKPIPTTESQIDGSMVVTPQQISTFFRDVRGIMELLVGDFEDYGTEAHPTFAKWKAAGFGDHLIPIIPPGAKLAPGSRLSPDRIGKVPGILKADGCGWLGKTGWGTAPPPTDAELAKWDSWGAGIGLRGGRLVFVDIDIYDTAIADMIDADAKLLLGSAPVRTGQAPKRTLMYLLAEGETPPKKRCAELTLPGSAFEHKIEILASGQQCVVDGIHPRTLRPYTWDRHPTTIGMDGLTTVTVAQLDQFLHEMVEKLKGKNCVVGPVSKSGNDSPSYKLGTPEAEHLKAPSLESVAEALAILPNELARDEWVAMSHAIKAAVGGDEGFYPDYEEWCLKSPVCEPHHAQGMWDSISESRLGADYVFRRAADWGFNCGAIDFSPMEETSPVAPARSGLPIHTVREGLGVTVWPPKRPFLLGTRLLVGAVTLGAGAPKVGKSMLALVTCVAIVTGRQDMTGEKVHLTGPALYFDDEEDMDELERRLIGICRVYGIDPASLAGRLFLWSGKEKPLVVGVKEGGQSVVKRTTVAEALVDALKVRGCVHLAAGPFVALHGGMKENDSADIDAVAGIIRQICVEAGVSADLTHHTVKDHSGNSESRAGDYNAARGSGAAVGKSRGGYLWPSGWRCLHESSKSRRQPDAPLPPAKEGRHRLCRL